MQLKNGFTVMIEEKARLMNFLSLQVNNGHFWSFLCQYISMSQPLSVIPFSSYWWILIPAKNDQYILKKPKPDMVTLYKAYDNHCSSDIFATNWSAHLWQLVKTEIQKKFIPEHRKVLMNSRHWIILWVTVAHFPVEFDNGRYCLFHHQTWIKKY